MKNLSSIKIGRPLSGQKCPTCGKLGSGLHRKWVLNCVKKRYFPYYYFAHSIKLHGRKAIQWCYVKKSIALGMLKK